MMPFYHPFSLSISMMSMKYKIINQVYSTIINFSYVVQITYIALFTYLKKVYLATFVQFCFHEEVTSNICTMKFKRATQNKDSENYIADFHCLSIYNHVRCCMVISNYYLSIIMLTITVFLCYFRRSSYLVTHKPLAYIYRTIIHSLKTLRTLITLIAIALKEQLITFSTVIFS